MKGNPSVPGGLLTSKPTWLNALGCLATSVFFAGNHVRSLNQARTHRIMNDTTDGVRVRVSKVVGTLAGPDRYREPATVHRVGSQAAPTSTIVAGPGPPHAARTPLAESSHEADRKVSYHCPVCGSALPHLAPVPPFDAPCFECHAYLWCRRRNPATGVVLEAVPGRAPEAWEVKRVVDSLERQGAPDRVILDLSRLDIIYCSLVAALVGMQKQLQVSGRTLSLCGLRPVVRETFDQLRLNMLFAIVMSEDDVAMCV